MTPTTVALITSAVWLAVPTLLTFLGELASKAGFDRTAHALLAIGPDVRRLIAGPPKDGGS